MRRIIATLAVALLLLTAFQLADPRLGSADGEPVRVDADAPADELSRDAIRGLYRSNFSYEYVVGDNRTFTNPEFAWSARVETASREFKSVSMTPSDGPLVYGTTDAAFVRPLPDSSWRVKPDRQVTYRNYVTHPLAVDRITEANSRVVNRTDGVAVVHVDRRLVREAILPGYSLVYVDTERGELRKVVGVVQKNGTVAGYDRVAFSNVGTTTVDRPSGTRFKPFGILLDLLR